MNFYKHVRETLRLSIPLIVGHLGHMLMGVTDSIMVGRVGTQSLAASAISNVLFFLVLVLGLGISMAVTPLVAQAFGAGENKQCGVVLRQGLLVNLLTSLVLFGLTLLLADSLKFMHQPPEIVEPASIYMKVLGFSIFPMMIFQTYKQFAEGLSVITSAMIIALLANLVNVFANWVFIFGHLGVPAMGLTGAGFGTFSSRTFMAIAMIVVVVRSPYLKTFDPSLHYRKIDWEMIRKLMKIGIPAGFQYVFEVSSFAGASVVIGWIGTRELAAHQIALNLASISYMVSLGISSAATVRVGTALGRMDARETRLAGFSAVVLCAMFMTVFALVFIGLRNILPTFYVSDPEVISIASGILVLVALFQISDGTQAVGIGMLRGIMDMKIPTVMTFAAYWVIGIPSGYILGIRWHMGVTGVWLGLFVGLSASAIMMLVRFHRISRISP
ncbi:MAG: MATE family efflux transporter [Proteobacteria bacterium]|nr:MATE family efflux transporter [Pseudomonadota bacterium]